MTTWHGYAAPPAAVVPPLAVPAPPLLEDALAAQTFSPPALGLSPTVAATPGYVTLEQRCPWCRTYYGLLRVSGRAEFDLRCGRSKCQARPHAVFRVDGGSAWRVLSGPATGLAKSVAVVLE